MVVITVISNAEVLTSLCIYFALQEVLSGLYKLNTQLNSELGRCGIALGLFEEILQLFPSGTKTTTKTLENSHLGPRFEKVLPQ